MISLLYDLYLCSLYIIYLYFYLLLLVIFIFFYMISISTCVLLSVFSSFIHFFSDTNLVLMSHLILLTHIPATEQVLSNILFKRSPYCGRQPECFQTVFRMNTLLCFPSYGISVLTDTLFDFIMISSWEFCPFCCLFFAHFFYFLEITLPLFFGSF